MGLFSGITKQFRKVTGAVKKVVKGVAKNVKKTIKGVAKVVKKIGKGVKKLAKNKYVRMGLMIAAAVTLPMFVPAIAALPAVAAGAVTGAITGGAGALLSGGDLKDVLKGAAFGSATGAAFAKIGEAIKTAKAAKVGGESLDLTQGKLDAMGADVPDIAATATDAAPTISLDASPTIDTSSLPRDAFGQIDLDQLTTTDSAFRTTSLDVSKGLDVSSDVLKDPNLFTNVPELKLTARGTRSVLSSSTGMSEQVAQSLQDFKLDTSALTDTQRQALGLYPKISPTDIKLAEPQSFGDKLKGKLKDAFSPEKLTDTALGFAEDAVVGGLRNLAVGDQEEAYEGGRQYQAGVVDPLLLQQVQYAHAQESVDFNTSHQNLLYGTADMAHYTPLQTQEILRIS